MQEAAAFTPEEQKYFDTKGADGPANDGTPPPSTETDKPSAAAPVATEPAKEPDKSAEPDDKDNPGKFVRLAALHEERERRRELSRSLEQERLANAEFRARAEERLNFLARQNEPPPQPQDPMQTLQELQQWKQQEEQQRQQTITEQRQYTALKNAVDQAEAAFTQEKPDYYDAVDFAKQARDRELAIFGFPPNVRQQIIQDDIKAVSIGALQRGVSPAEVFYNFAVERGYKGKQPEPMDTAAKAINDAASKLNKIAEGQAAGKSLGAAAGTATPALTLENLANMSDDEFAKVALNKKEWRKLMGG